MILLLGSGYVGQALVTELHRRNIDYFAMGHGMLSHSTFREAVLVLKACNPELVINCAAFIQKSSVDLNKNYPGETIMGNVVFPATLANACEIAEVPLMHLSTGCLYDEQREYSEDDPPIRGFGGYCGFYVGTKLLSEEVVRQYPKHYILRIRLPFDQFSNERNYLNKLIVYPKVFTHLNSLTHRGDFAKAALDLWDLRAPFGTYHCVNPGQITAHRVVALMMKAGIITKEPKFVESETTGCRLSTRKLVMAGVKIRYVYEAVEDSLRNWTANV
jgi:dTDP-4-dehydrorhamnose reductase